MLSESMTLKGEVITFVGPVNMSGFEKVNENEIEFLKDLACDAGATISKDLTDLTTLVVKSELTAPKVLDNLPNRLKIVSEEEFLEKYLTEVITGAEWE